MPPLCPTGLPSQANRRRGRARLTRWRTPPLAGELEDDADPLALDRARHLRHAGVALGERDRHLAHAQARAESAVRRLDLDHVPARDRRADVDLPERVGAPELE